MSVELLGKNVADAMKERVTARVEACKAKGVEPTLAFIRVGERPDDLSYQRGATKRAAAWGIATKEFVLPADATQDQLLEVIAQVNADASVHGVLMFRPLPKGISDAAACAALDPAKDIDGITEGSLAGVFMDRELGFPPCTAQACVEILDHYEIPVKGKNVAVIGRSLVIGKPVAMMLLRKNATVTICHSRTTDLAAVTQAADIVICATGRPKAYGADNFKAGQTVLDVGINFDEEGNMCGDADYAAVAPIVDAITPVPRGVGSVTTAVLMEHVVTAAERTLA